ncbi:HDOD domain-containing protein [Caldichromatium japonicum]|uniref:HDOD domain-containing protein n=1 Tax=Caldichromatium japonicum TaxID=2699430 RepID=A0A6G7VBT4_9GAMM|nr:HDOD domain-containing protein [Caldichromatium japonicum]QIK37412.1 HDOD domain-containing protein [Caldichromatium japonicum]
MNIVNWLACLFGGRPNRDHEAANSDFRKPPKTDVSVAEPESWEASGCDELAEPVCAVSSQQVDDWFYPWLFECDAFEDLPLTPSETSLLNAFKQVAAGQRLSNQLVPRLPMVIPQVMRSLKDERMSGIQLARQIAKDPVLVGEVIRVANSPYYRRARKIASLEQAIVLLGRDGLQQLIARVAFYPIFKLRGGHVIHQAAARVWCQSEGCALVCHCLAKRFEEDMFAAYLSGLVANLGLIVGLRLMDQQLALGHDPLPRAASFYREFIVLARQLSQRIIEDWSFPKEVIAALSEQIEPDGEGAHSPLGRCLRLGERYSKLHLLIDKGHLSVGDFDAAALMADPCYRRLLVESTA